MTPKEFNIHLRDALRQDLPKHLALVKSVISMPPSAQEDPLTRIINDVGGVLRDGGIVDGPFATKANRLCAILTRNREIDAYVRRHSTLLVSDAKAVRIQTQLFLDPSSVKEEDFNYVYDLLLRDEALTVGVLEVILRDHNVRTELGMGSQAEADAYVGNVRYAIQTSRTWQDWVEKAKDFGFLGPFVCGPTVCAAAVVWAAALTVALAWNYVYVANVAVAVNVTFATASGTATAMESSQMMPAQPRTFLISFGMKPVAWYGSFCRDQPEAANG